MAHGGMDAKMGAKKSEMKKRNATQSAVRPVRPPSRIPVADSTKVVTGDVPRHEPTTMAVASDMKAGYWPGKLPSSSTARGEVARDALERRC